MRSLWRWISAAISVVALAGQPGLPPETALLSRVKQRAVENLRALPNYTCSQTIERSERAPSSSRYEFLDRLRLEVALIDGRELFAWPGAGSFEDREVTEMIVGGAMGTGNFALHVNSIFNGEAPVFTYGGREIRDGRPLIRFEYRLSRRQSGFRLRAGEREALVGHHGSFWVSAETLDLVRLEVVAEDNPPELGITRVTDTVEYQSVRIGDVNSLLPVFSELVMTVSEGSTTRNVTRFSQCRQYGAESLVYFGEAAPGAGAAARAKPDDLSLPGGLTLELALETPIDSETSAVGDALRARVLADVKRDGVTVIPKGALAVGRIRELRRQTRPVRLYRLALQFSSLEFGGKRTTFPARLDALLPGGGPFLPYSSGASARISPAPSGGSPGLGVVIVTGNRLRIVSSLHMIWRTVEIPGKGL